MKQCICLERIGDNGPCPEHGEGYASGAASAFASAARDVATIEISIKEGCFIGERLFVKGDILTARNLGNGLWVISSPSMELRDFVHLSTQDVNKLAGFELVKEA